MWITLTELSNLKGVGKPALSERVSKLEQRGLITTKPGPRKTKLINVAEYDRVLGQVTDLGREQGQATRRGGGEAGDSDGGTASSAYAAQQARRAGYIAEMARLDLEERLGNLITVTELRPVIEASGKAVAETIDSLTHEADALREAAQSEDATAFDRLFKMLTRQLRTKAMGNVRAAMPSRKQGGGAEVAIKMADPLQSGP